MNKMDPDHKDQDDKQESANLGSSISHNMNSGSYMNENLGMSIIDEGRLNNLNRLNLGNDEFFRNSRLKS
jgi:hypothetical protein